MFSPRCQPLAPVFQTAIVAAVGIPNALQALAALLYINVGLLALSRVKGQGQGQGQGANSNSKTEEKQKKVGIPNGECRGAAISFTHQVLENGFTRIFL